MYHGELVQGLPLWLFPQEMLQDKVPAVTEEGFTAAQPTGHSELVAEPSQLGVAGGGRAAPRGNGSDQVNSSSTQCWFKLL